MLRKLALCSLALTTLIAFGIACGSSKKAPIPSPSATPSSVPTATATAQSAETPLAAAGLGKVAYIFEGDVYAIDLPSGSPVRLTTDGVNASPKWSPSGEWIIFRKLHSNWVMRADGTDARALTEGPAVWATTDDRIAYDGGPPSRA